VAIRVRRRAQAFRLDVVRASIIASLEKKPARKGVPVKARLPMVMHEVVVGNKFCIPPIFRMSCSSFKEWIIDPAHKNNMALKNAWVQMCKKASCGWLRPIVTIISPSWLDVENAMIFLMSLCVRAQVAVNSVVSPPRQRHVVKAVGLVARIGLTRTSKKIPATTIVLECSRADTGVGPSIAAGSQG